MPRYFVTGATGFLGAEVAKQLLSRGHQVAALVRDPAKATLLARLGAELHAGDITDPATLRVPMRGVDGVFHVAGVVQDRRILGPATLATAVNVDGTRHVLTAMRDLGIPQGRLHQHAGGQLRHARDRRRRDLPLRRAAPVGLRPRRKWQAHYEVARR